jgi:hypothetical protein
MVGLSIGPNIKGRPLLGRRAQDNWRRRASGGRCIGAMLLDNVDNIFITEIGIR